MKIDRNNPIIYHPAINNEDMEFKMQERRNNKCKLIIESLKRKGKIKMQDIAIISFDTMQLREA